MTTQPRSSLTRRQAIQAAGAGGAVAALTVAAPPGAAQAAPHDPDARRRQERIAVGRNSPNGWPMEKGVGIGGQLWDRPLPGTGTSLAVRTDTVEVVLTSFILRYHYEVTTLEDGDVVGYRPYSSRIAGHQRNHASGTAVDILPGRFPRGITGNLFPQERAAIRSILADYAGTVRWGGDFATPDEAHFEIAVPPGHSRLAMVVDHLRRNANHLGREPGVRAR